MQSQKPLTVILEPDPLQCWAEESTASASRALAGGSILRDFRFVRQLPPSKRLAYIDHTRRYFSGFTALLRRLKIRRRQRRRGSPSMKPRLKIKTEWYWLYAAIDVETKLLLNVMISDRRGTDPAAEFLSRLAEKHDLWTRRFSSTEWVI